MAVNPTLFKFDLNLINFADNLCILNDGCEFGKSLQGT